MAMQLNIKSDEAYRLALRLAELTGETPTAAVTAALRRRVAEEERRPEQQAMFRDVRALMASPTSHLL